MTGSRASGVFVRAGGCLGTLRPGAPNLVTAVADAYLDRAPLVALSGQRGPFVDARGVSVAVAISAQLGDQTVTRT